MTLTPSSRSHTMAFPSFPSFGNIDPNQWSLIILNHIIFDSFSSRIKLTRLVYGQ